MTEKRNPMSYKPIFPLLMTMAFPPMISMLIQSLYNIVDSIFVAQLGEEALTAVSLIYPLQNLSLAFSCGVGIAMNALIARHLGASEYKKASYIASQGIVMTLLHSLLFVILGLFFIQPFLTLFTNNPKVIQYGNEYGMIVITLTFSPSGAEEAELRRNLACGFQSGGHSYLCSGKAIRVPGWQSVRLRHCAGYSPAQISSGGALGGGQPQRSRIYHRRAWG